MKTSSDWTSSQRGGSSRSRFWKSHSSPLSSTRSPTSLKATPCLGWRLALGFDFFDLALVVVCLHSLGHTHALQFHYCKGEMLCGSQLLVVLQRGKTHLLQHSTELVYYPDLWRRGQCSAGNCGVNPVLCPNNYS